MAGEETPTRKSFRDKNFQPRLRATVVGLPLRATDGTARTPVLSRNGCGTTCEPAFATAVGRFVRARAVAQATAESDAAYTTVACRFGAS